LAKNFTILLGCYTDFTIAGMGTVRHPRTPGRTTISVVAVTPRREFMKYPG